MPGYAHTPQGLDRFRRRFEPSAGPFPVQGLWLSSIGIICPAGTRSIVKRGGAGAGKRDQRY